MKEKNTRWRMAITNSGPGKALGRFRDTSDKAEDSFRAFLYRWRFVLFVVAVTILAFAGRVGLWYVISGDFNEFLHPWLDEIRIGRGLRSIGTQIGNYTAPYHYLLAVMAHIPGLTNLTVIKLTSSLADFFTAAAAGVLCWQLLQVKWKAIVCYALVLCMPTVFMNSAAWGQCDAMYTFFVLLFAIFYLQGNKNAALFCFGIAQSIKLQAVFVLPAIIILWICGRLRIRNLLCAVLGYVVMFIPAMIGDGSLAPMYRAYVMQTELDSLSSNIFNGPSLFFGADVPFMESVSNMLIFGTIIAVGIIALYCWQNKARFTRQTDFLLIALMTVVVPFLLPGMRDRYYYMLEIFVVIYALVWPRRFWAPAFVQLASLISYMVYLKSANHPFGSWPVAGILAVAFAFLWDLRAHFAAAVPRQSVPDSSTSTPKPSDA